jgi:hypothetical protein
MEGTRVGEGYLRDRSGVPGVPVKGTDPKNKGELSLEVMTPVKMAVPAAGDVEELVVTVMASLRIGRAIDHSSPYGPLPADPPLDPPVEHAQRGLGPPQDLCGHPQGDGHPVLPLSRATLLLGLVALVLPRAQTQPRREVLLRREAADVDTDLSEDHQSRPHVDPVDLRQVDAQRLQQRPTGVERAAGAWRLSAACSSPGTAPAELCTPAEAKWMVSHPQLTEVFDRGLRDGVDALSPADRQLFRIQDFVIEHEMGGLSAYLYNRLPDLDGICAAVAAMQRHGLAELAVLLGEAAGLFAGYIDPDPPATWGEVRRRYDPAGRLDELDSRIGALDNYGLA